MPKKNIVAKKSKAVAVYSAKPKAKLPKAAKPERGAAMELACSVADPWSCSACIPDGSTGTGCFTIKQEVQLTTGSSGTCVALAAGLAPHGFYAADTGSTNSTPTFTNWTTSTNNASIAALYSAFRPVSAGIRVVYSGNTQTDGGTLLVGQVQTSAKLTDLSGKTMVQAADLLMNYEIIPLRNGAQVVWTPESITDQAQWQATNASLITGGTPMATPFIIVIAYGLNVASSALTCEVVTNFEGQFKSQSFMPGGLAESKKATIEVGWYEKTKLLLKNLKPIVPVITGSMMASGNPVVSGLGYLANGLLAPGAFGKGQRAR